MNSPVVIASAILAVAIVVAAWLLKPPCWTSWEDSVGHPRMMMNGCTGELWTVKYKAFGEGRLFPK